MFNFFEPEFEDFIEQNLDNFKFIELYTLKDISNKCGCAVLKFEIDYISLEKISNGKYSSIGIVNTHLFTDILEILYYELPDTIGFHSLRAPKNRLKFLRKIINNTDGMNIFRNRTQFENVSELITYIAAPLILEKLKTLVGSATLKFAPNAIEFNKSVKKYLEEEKYKIRIPKTSEIITVFYSSFNDKKPDRINVYTLYDLKMVKNNIIEIIENGIKIEPVNDPELELDSYIGLSWDVVNSSGIQTNKKSTTDFNSEEDDDDDVELEI